MYLKFHISYKIKNPDALKPLSTSANNTLFWFQISFKYTFFSKNIVIEKLVLYTYLKIHFILSRFSVHLKIFQDSLRLVFCKCTQLFFEFANLKISIHIWLNFLNHFSNTSIYGIILQNSTPYQVMLKPSYNQIIIWNSPEANSRDYVSDIKMFLLLIVGDIFVAIRDMEKHQNICVHCRLTYLIFTDRMYYLIVNIE